MFIGLIAQGNASREYHGYVDKVTLFLQFHFLLLRSVFIFQKEFISSQPPLLNLYTTQKKKTANKWCLRLSERQQQEISPRCFLQRRRSVRERRHPGRRRFWLLVLPRPHRGHLQVEGGECCYCGSRGRHGASFESKKLHRLWCFGKFVQVCIC